MFELKIETDFSAAHKLTMVGEKCENLHGHNWKIEVCVTGENLDEGGVLMDFGIIKRHVAEIMDLLDHTYLNEIEAFANKPASSENIAFFIAQELKKRIKDPSINVSRVSAWESKNSCATYIV